MTTELQLTMNGEINGFESIEELAEYLIKNWKYNYYASIRKVKILDKEVPLEIPA
jgi:hypothetical protein